MSIFSHLGPCVCTQSPKYLEMAQGHISLSLGSRSGRTLILGFVTIGIKAVESLEEKLARRQFDTSLKEEGCS
jgi:hypothetical protein